MKRFALVMLLFLAIPLLVFGQQQSVLEIPFDSTADLLKLPPDFYLGEASGVAVNSKGHIFVFSRGNTTGPAYAASAAQLLEFGADGKFLREIGHNLYAWSFAHAVKVDKEDSRVGGGAPLGADLRPPPKLHRRICRMQLSRRLRETRRKEKELNRAGAQARTRRKAGT
jgi:hypothetical protein